MMYSLLRQIVAGPRAKHAETGLDLCYVTSNIIVTSGPSQKYPQRAYRNPLDRLVAFLDAKHGDGWAIWEFRAEGTGYPDEAVYGRIRHYPWPDHHPPPFGLVPLIMASMRQWLDGDESAAGGAEQQHQKQQQRVLVAHCKAGKGRSGTMACSYLISQCGWTPQDALARFTERRMRPRFGGGVTIPSQLRWVGYVDRWTRGGCKYVDGDVEVVEVRVRGLRQGVKVSVRGFVNEGKKIRPVHTFTKAERMGAEGGGDASKGQATSEGATPGGSEPGGQAVTVTFKPAEPIRVPNGDVNVAMERSHSAPSSVGLGLTMVTSVAHVWFNAFFEGRGPEQDGKPDAGGVFEVAWDDMDGIKGSTQKGVRACDGVSVVWRFVAGVAGSGFEAEAKAEAAAGLDGDGPVPQMRPADWKGGNDEDASTQTSPEDSGLSGDEDLKGVKTSGPSGEDIDINITEDIGLSSMAH